MLQLVKANPRNHKSCQLRKSSRKISNDCFSEPQCEEKCGFVNRQACTIKQELECNIVQESVCAVMQDKECSTIEDVKCNIVNKQECQTGINSFSVCM